MSNPADNLQPRWAKWLLIPIIAAGALYLWLWLTPSATIHYHEDAKDEQWYVWNVQHRIYRGQMEPGGGSFGSGYLFPDDGFFMEFGWWNNKDPGHCISITPTLRGTHVYLDANGNIDWRPGSGTDVELLKRCELDTTPP